MWMAFPSADYYGNSVAVGLASDRPSRAWVMQQAIAWGRWLIRPLSGLIAALSPHEVAPVIITDHAHGAMSFYDAYRQVFWWTESGLSLKQSSFHHFTQVLQDRGFKHLLSTSCFATRLLSPRPFGSR